MNRARVIIGNKQIKIKQITTITQRTNALFYT